MAKKSQARKQQKAKAANKNKIKTAQISGPSLAQQAKWQAEDDMHVLMRSEEIRKDTKRMNAARRMAQQKAKEAAAIATKLKR